MAYQALYRKYRPKTFSEVYGQDHITKVLKNSLASGKTVHAYLFTGTRGTGKTTCAKILARAVNCLSPVNGEPCGECEICREAAAGTLTDIVEIDAASHNGVDDIRQLRDQVAFAPAVAKYRVYIIDEVHMLSGSAFNALLKTLEEPPRHAIFILATTEVHKIPATILSRCQRFDFRRIESDKICERLQYVAQNEGFTLADDAALLIASAADGGMRDALSILDLCAAATKDITEDTVASVCSMAGNDYLIELAACIKSQDAQKALTLISRLHNSSVDMLRLLSELVRHFRDLMVIKTVKSENLPIVCSAARLSELRVQAEKFDIREIVAILDILQSSAAAMQSGNPREVMELTLIRLCNPRIRRDPETLELRIAALEAAASAVQNAPVTADAATIAEAENTPAPQADGQKEEPAAGVSNSPQQAANAEEKTDLKDNRHTDEPQRIEKWQQIIDILKGSCPIIAGVLEGSGAYISEDRLLIDTQNSQFISLFNNKNSLYRDSIRKAAQQVLGANYKLGPYRKSEASALTDPLAAFAEKLKSLENQKE